MQDILIRAYRHEDRQKVRAIAWETAFMGEPAGRFFQDKEVLVDFLTRYFTDYEPGSSFVAQVGDEVVGYLIGAMDVEVLRKISSGKIFGPLLLKCFRRGFFLKKKNVLFLWYCLKSFLRGEFRLPDFSLLYPATLHINIREGFRGHGIGGRLIARFLSLLREKGVSGVHFATFSPSGHDFFLRQGFTVLHEGRRSYFRNLLSRDVAVYIFGKQL